MNELKQLDKKAWEWPMGVPTQLWCKHFFSFYSKYGILMNKLSELTTSKGVSSTTNDDQYLDAMIEEMMTEFEDQSSQNPHS